MSDAIGTSRERLLATVRSGAWERVPAEADAYAAAVRADERQRVVGEALELARSALDPDRNADESLDDVRARLLSALDLLR